MQLIMMDSHYTMPAYTQCIISILEDEYSGSSCLIRSRYLNLIWISAEYMTINFLKFSKVTWWIWQTQTSSADLCLAVLFTTNRSKPAAQLCGRQENSCQKIYIHIYLQCFQASKFSSNPTFCLISRVGRLFF